MPSLYKGNHFDIAGFLIGIKERYKTLNVKGDLIFGIKSNGFHSNGFSLIRKIISKIKLILKEQNLINKSFLIL